MYIRLIRIIMPLAKSYRNMMITINNFTQQDEMNITTKDQIKNYVYQIEKGTSGTEHIQGYIEWKNPYPAK